MAGVIKYARLHLGTCSAPRHIAVAVDTPSLIIMGSTSPLSWTYPSKDHQTAVLDIPCRPCNKDTCPDIRCMYDLMPEQVLSDMERMLAGNSSVQGD
jgi:ADP-heptose:LPS heptosyltransferase